MSKAGRKTGSSNKNKAFLMNRLKDMYGEDFDPILKMAENATRMHQTALETSEESQILYACEKAVNAWDKIAQYVQPKLKAVELSGDVGTVDKTELVKEFKKNLTEQEAAELYQRIMGAK